MRLPALPRSRLALAATLLAICALVYVYAESVWIYASDPHYRAHFLFLWGLFAVALVRAARGPMRGVLATLGRREWLGLLAYLLALALVYVGSVTGSSTAQRVSLVCVFTAFALLVLRQWSCMRALAYGLFALLCFGLPYSAYFAVTGAFRTGVVAIVGALATALGYTQQGATIVYPHYRLAITDDCSGVNQIVVFTGLAFLGALTGRPRPPRIATLFAAGLALGFVSNIVRVMTFVLLVGFGWTRSVDDPVWHEAIGFLACAPFLAGFVIWILRTHEPRVAAAGVAQGAARGLPVWTLVVPLVLLHLLGRPGASADRGEPAWFAGITHPPGYSLEMRAASELRERAHYETPWLVNARFKAEDGRRFDLLCYETRSRGQLAVHKIANCLDVPGRQVSYGPSVDVLGRRFWTLEIADGTERTHGYYAFHIGGRDFDDSLTTQIEVLRQRMSGGAGDVGLTRVLIPGPRGETMPEDERALLAWRAASLESPRF